MMAAAAAWLFYQSRIAVVILSPFAFPYCLYRLKREEEKDPLGAVQGTAGQREQCAQIRGFPGECLSGRI